MADVSLAQRSRRRGRQANKSEDDAEGTLVVDADKGQSGSDEEGKLSLLITLDLR